MSPAAKTAGLFLLWSSDIAGGAPRRSEFLQIRIHIPIERIDVVILLIRQVGNHEVVTTLKNCVVT